MFSVPALQYDYDALAPVVSKEVMELHHDKHHQAYVDKLNTAVADYPELQNLSVEALLARLDTLPEAIRTTVRNNGGGHYNHSLFWVWMRPAIEGNGPTGELEQAIITRYGSIKNFTDEFNAKAVGVFGSGWVFLQPNMDIITTANQDSPVMNSGEEALLGLDVWEHAYYLDYYNKRADYAAAWWNVVNWDTVNERFERFSK